MRALLVDPRLDRRGGAERVVAWMARGLGARGHRIAVATQAFDPGCWEPGDWDGVEVHRLPALPGTARLPGALQSRLRGRQLARLARGRDWIVAHNAPATAWAAAARLAKGTRRLWFCEEPRLRLHWRSAMPRVAEAVDHPERYPWLGDVHGGRRAQERGRRRRWRMEQQRRRDRSAVAAFDLVLANSRFTAANASHIHGREIRACALGAPEPIGAAGAEKPAVSPPYIAWVGSPLPHKNALGLLEAVRRAVHRNGARDLRLRALGIDTPDLRARIEEWRLGEHVLPEAPVSDAGLARFLGESRLVVYPPLDEPFGLVPVEAMALGRPVVSSSVGGPAETVVDGVTGRLANPLDPDALAAALLELWRDPERCRAFGEAGRRRWEESLDFEHFLDRFETCLEKV